MWSWSPRRIALIWLAWTALLAVAYFAFTHSDVFASVNISLPLPTSFEIGHHQIAHRISTAIAVAYVFVILYLPPIAVTVGWLVMRRLRPAEHDRET